MFVSAIFEKVSLQEKTSKPVYTYTYINIFTQSTYVHIYTQIQKNKRTNNVIIIKE